MGRKPNPPHPDGELANLDEYNLAPMSLSGEKVVTDKLGSFTACLMAFMIGRMREKGIPISGLGRAMGRKAEWLSNIYAGTQRDAYLNSVLEGLDFLGLEVVVRLKRTGTGNRPSSLKASKILAAGVTEPKVIIVEVDKPAKHDPTGVISEEARRDIDRMLAR